MKTKEEIIELANNMSIEDIIEQSKIVREGIRHYFNRLLSDKEKHTIKTNILIKDPTTIGLAHSQKPILDSIYEYRDVIYFSIDNMIYELDEIELNTQLNVLKEFI